MDETGGDKNYIENLLKAMPVNEAINSFTEIDNRILELLKCSSDDFMSLNDQFKNYHKESKLISQNANSIIEILTNSKTSKSFSSLRTFSKSFEEVALGFSKHIELLDFEIKKTTNTIENLRIAHNNYKQDLSSVRIMIAGMGQDNGNSVFSTSEANQIGTMVENIKKHFADSEGAIQEYISYATENCLFLTNLKKDNFERLQKINEKIEVSLKLFEKKYSEAASIVPTLKSLTEKNTSNIAAIITNLQYHDIIRQKIEHIQRTHKDIMSDLKNYDAAEQTMAIIHNKAKTFLKIRDVAGLQAAQLLHANKQYQTAIEEIGNNLECIGNDMIAISITCDNLVGKSEQTKNTYFTEIVTDLNLALEYTFNLNSFLSEIIERMKLLAEKNSNIYMALSIIIQEKEKIREIVTNPTKLESINKASNKKAIEQLVQLLDDTDKIELHIKDIHSTLSNNLNKLKDPFVSLNNDKNSLGPLDSFSGFIPELISHLTKDIEKVDEYLYLNSTISHKISDNITNSLGGIKYYEMFENSCERIIEELNTINVKLNYGDSSDNHNRKENLKMLKARYTMASEHIIHDQIARMHENETITEDNAEKIIDMADQNSADDDDNLELF